MAILSDEAKKLIAEIRPGLVATSDASGLPNVSPKGSFRVLDDEHVMFADVRSPRTVANLAANPKVSVLVLDAATRRGVRVWGQAEVLQSGEVFDQVAAEMATRKMKVNNVVVIGVDDFVIL